MDEIIHVRQTLTTRGFLDAVFEKTKVAARTGNSTCPAEIWKNSQAARSAEAREPISSCVAPKGLRVPMTTRQLLNVSGNQGSHARL